MKKLLVVLVLMGILVAAVLPVTASACTQGLTPGYWKQPQHFDAWVTYSPTSNFLEVFGVGPDASLLEVLWTGGGEWNALNRHAVAALLNSTVPGTDFYLTSEVISGVQWAYSTGNWEYVKDILVTANESGES